MIPVDCFQRNHYEIRFTSNDVGSKFRRLQVRKMDIFHLNETMRTEWLQMIDEYWYEENIPYPSNF